MFKKRLSHEHSHNDPILDRIDRLNDCKDEMVITIFGPYRPPHVKERLERLQNFLYNNGYHNAKIVADRDDPPDSVESKTPQDFFKKSIYWAENSDVLFFILSPNLDLSGVVTELTHWAKGTDQIWRSIVFIEGEDLEESGEFSMMISGLMDEYDIVRIPFDENDDESLQTRVLGRLKIYIEKLHVELIERRERREFPEYF